MRHTSPRDHDPVFVTLLIGTPMSERLATVAASGKWIGDLDPRPRNATLNPQVGGESRERAAPDATE